LVAAVAVAVVPVAGCRFLRPTPHAAKTPEPCAGCRYDQKTQIAFHAGKLWSRNEGGLVQAFDAKTGRLFHPLPGENVVDLERTLDDRLWALATREGGAVVLSWTASDAEDGGAFRVLARIDTGPGEPSPPIAVASLHGRPVVLTTRAVFVVEADGAVRRAELDKTYRGDPRRPTAFAVTAAGLAYSGVNYGEFGGYLRRIDLATGWVEDFEEPTRAEFDRSIGRAHSTPPFSPVTAMIADPDRPDCVLAGIGLHHMFSRKGKLLRVCDRRIDVVEPVSPAVPPSRSDPGSDSALAALLRRPELTCCRRIVPPRPFPSAAPSASVSVAASTSASPASSASADARETDGDDVSSDEVHPWPSLFDGPSTAIFGLERTRHGYWMVTGDDLVHVEGGRVERRPFPPILVRRGVSVGLVDGVVATETGMNGRVSAGGGGTPLLAVLSLDDPPPRSAREVFTALAAPSPVGRCWIERSSSDSPPGQGPERARRTLCFDEQGYEASYREHHVRGPITWQRDTDADWVGTVSPNETLRLWIGDKTAVLTDSALPDEPWIFLDPATAPAVSPAPSAPASPR
jgi:hypothetical protein